MEESTCVPAKGQGEDREDPGASRHGNFMNYYQFHGAEERVRQLPSGVWRRSGHPVRKSPYLALDVGCNAGDLTYALYEFLVADDNTEVGLMGVDLDPILIERARERNPRPDRIVFECLDFLSQDFDERARNYLEAFKKQRFDTVFCFSVTMWIHLNHGDDGLEEFLRKACAFAETIVIEPQIWKCYRNASRRLRRSKGEDFPLLKTLRYTGDMTVHVQDILTRLCGFRKVAVTPCNDWKRTVLVYSRE